MPSANDPADASENGEPRYVTTFDPESEPASEAVVTAVSALVGSKPATLEPLYEVVDPDALDSMVEHARRTDDDGTHQLWFTYEGIDVGVRTDGEIRLREATVASNADLE